MKREVVLFIICEKKSDGKERCWNNNDQELERYSGPHDKQYQTMWMECHVGTSYGGTHYHKSIGQLTRASVWIHEQGIGVQQR